MTRGARCVSPIRISCARAAMRFTTCAPFRSRRRPSTADSCAANSTRPDAALKSTCARAIRRKPSPPMIAWRPPKSARGHHRYSWTCARSGREWRCFARPGGDRGEVRLTPLCSRRARGIGVLFACVFAMSSRPLPAHERSESFSHWTYASGRLSGIVTVRAREVTRLTLPGEGYGSLTRIFAAHLEKTVAAAVDGKRCAPLRSPQPLESEAGYIRIGLEMRCSPGESLDIRAGAFFDVAPSHHHFIYAESSAGAGREAILTVSARDMQLELKPTQASGERFLKFVEMGVLHIATGIDHLAFLLALLVAARNG